MTDICEKLPIELANIVYSFLGEHPVAKLVREDDENQNEFCCNCDLYLAEKDEEKKHFYKNKYICSKSKKGLCEYCYGENELGVEVHTCVDCGNKSFEWTDKFINTEDGLYCRMGCYSDYLERMEEEEEGEEEEDLD